jgi:hypothetical protein
MQQNAVSRVWKVAPAYVCASGLLIYAVEKAYYATQNRLGLPGGPHVPAEAYEQLGHVALRQWTLAGIGLLGAALALATVLPLGVRLPRWLILSGLWAALVPLVAGGFFLVQRLGTGDLAVSGFVRSVALLLLWAAMTWSFQRRTR